MMPADVQTNYGISSAHVQWFSLREKVEEMIMMSLSDVTVIAHATGGGKYIRKASLSFRVVIWVVWH